MRLSRERLQREATATGLRVEILEKVAQLLGLLDGWINTFGVRRG